MLPDDIKKQIKQIIKSENLDSEQMLQKLKEYMQSNQLISHMLTSGPAMIWTIKTFLYGINDIIMQGLDELWKANEVAQKLFGPDRIKKISRWIRYADKQLAAYDELYNALSNNDVTKLQQLFSRGIDITKWPYNGKSVASYIKSPEVLKLMLQKGININELDNMLEMWLSSEYEFNVPRDDILKLFEMSLSEGLDPNKQRSSDVHAGPKSTFLKQVRRELKEAEQKNDANNINFYLQIIELLKRHGALETYDPEAVRHAVPAFPGWQPPA